MDIPCALRVKGEVHAARLLDLSSGGAFVQFGEPLDCGTEVSIVFRVRRRRRLLYLDLQAIVVYCGRFLQGFENYCGFGACFKDPAPAKIAMLEKFIIGLEVVPTRKYSLT